MKTLQVITLGCSKNTVDTEHLLYSVHGSYSIVPEEEERPVDVLLINTCGFIGDAKEESVNTILRAVGRKQAGEIGKLIVFGCLSQRYPQQMKELIPEVDEWFGARDLAPVIKALGCTPKQESGRLRQDRRLPYAYLKISEGCNRRCSYCAIPFIRGAHHSVPIAVLEEEARLLAAEGVKELILIAQDTTYYGLDLYKRRALAELLEKLSAIEGIERLRIHYSYPADFPEDVLLQMAINPKVCRYLDIPLQHISDSVLSNMRRGVDGEWTRNLISKMRERVPGIVLRTTLIVGHPGEGRAEFAELMKFVKWARFERLGAFTYSEEDGTYGADHFRDSIRQSTKDRRLSRLMEQQKQISLEFNRSRIGTVTRVLADSFADGALICRSEFESPEVDGEIIVRNAPESLVGQFFDVRITGADEYDLTAELV